MASGSNYLTTYYAKRIIGDTAAANADSALLQIGNGVTNDSWILHKTGRATAYGIRYNYDYDNTRNTPEGDADKIEFLGKGSVTAWIQLDTGDTYFKGLVGIGTDTLTYRLNVAGQSYLNGAVGINTTPSTYILDVNGTSYLKGTATTNSFIPDADATYTIGEDDKRYTLYHASTGYHIYTDTALTNDDGFIEFVNNAQYLRLAAVSLGTNSQVGIGRLDLGNATASGTAGNARGAILMYGTNNQHIHLRANTGAAAEYFYFPSYQGTMYATHTADESAVGSNTSGTAQPVYVAAKGRLTAISNAIDVAYGGTGVTSHTGNRLVYSNSGGTAICAYNKHYADDTHIGINTTTAPSTTLYVNGTTYLNGNTSANGHIYLTKSKHIYMNYTPSGGTATDYPVLFNHDNGNVSLRAATGGLYLGWLSTNEIHMYTSDASTRTEWLTINSNGSYAQTRFGVNGQNTSYTLYVNGTTYTNNNITTTGKVYINNNTDVSGTNKNGSLVIGNKDGENLAFDANEIMARHGTADNGYTSNLNLNIDNSTDTSHLATVTVGGASDTNAYMSIRYTTAASSKTTGALRVSGGAGINGAVYASNFNGLTLTAASTGFTIAGGTTSKTLTVNESISLNAGAASKLAWYSAANTISGARNAYLIDESGDSVANKRNELVLGNAKAKATNGSSFGRLALFSAGTTGTYLVSAENSTAWYTATLPAKTGTLCLTDGTGASGSWGIDISGTAALTTALKNQGRKTNANLTHVTDGGMQLMLATSSMTSNKPSDDGFILHFHWDTSSAWDSQLYISDSGGAMQYRGSSAAGTWAAWKTILDSSNYSTYCATASHTHSYLPLSGGTITGWLYIKNDDDGPRIHFGSNDSTGATGGFIFMAMAQTNSIYRPNRYCFRIFSYNSSTGATDSSHCETYQLPQVTAGMNNTKTYNILTDKDLSFSITGSAAKLGTATVGSSNRPIYLNAGTATAVSWYTSSCSITSSNQNNYPWHRLAYANTGTTYADKSVIVVINQRHSTGKYGIIKLATRTNAQDAAKSVTATWLIRKGFAVGDVVIKNPTKTSGTDERIDVFIKCTTYMRSIAYILEGSNNGWTLVSSNEPADTTSSDKKGGTEINASVSGTTAAVDGGTVDYANSAGSADTATSATKDGSNNTITSYYCTLSTAQTFTGNKTFNSICYFANGTTYYVNKSGDAVFKTVKGAVWNDYAEYRECDLLPPGCCVQENDNGHLTISDRRLIPGASIITDTYGYAQGETETAQTPIAVSGRVLAYPFWPREEYHAGMAVCSGPNGTVDIMTREEIRDYPDAIIGIVSEIPNYEEWGTGKVKVDGRIWIKLK